MAGCALLRPAPAPIAEIPHPAATADAGTYVRELYERGRRLDSLQTIAIMEYRGADRHVKAREQIAIRRPARLRIEAFSPFGVAATVVANDQAIEIFDPSHNTLYRGRATADTLNRFVHIPLAPTAAANLMMGLAPDNAALMRAPSSTRAEDGMVVARYDLSGGAQELAFRDGQLARVRSYTSGNQLQFEVQYGGYQDIGGILFASTIEAVFPPSGTELKITFQRPIVNGPISETAFTLSAGSGSKIVDLDEHVAAPLPGS